MFDYGTFKLMHSHGKDLFSMEETSHHDAAQHDPERGWTKGARILSAALAASTRSSCCHPALICRTRSPPSLLQPRWPAESYGQYARLQPSSPLCAERPAEYTSALADLARVANSMPMA